MISDALIVFNVSKKDIETLNMSNIETLLETLYKQGKKARGNLVITWNYGQIFRQVLGKEGIRTIYGMTGAESIPVLRNAIDSLADDVDPDYWKPTEGNAKKALQGLLAFAQIRPDGIWKGD